MGCKRVATEPECPGKIAALREILQTRRTEGQELQSLGLSLGASRIGRRLGDCRGSADKGSARGSWQTC